MSTLKKKEPLLSSTNQWWKSLVDECPITLEPLSSLPYPPFVLRSGEKVSYFDGLALASYIVSRGIFQNPLTRQELTRADCRRLDSYLEEYWYNRDYQRLNSCSSSRRISVSEAFGLHQTVHVIGNGGQTDRRADALRHTATAALAGLFVYGNDLQRHQSDDYTSQQATRAFQPAHSPQSLEWGFDLGRTVEATAQFASEGWTVIDDDEAMVVATERQHYQATQNAFPRLLSSESETPRSSGTSTLSPDLHLVESVHAIAKREQLEQLERERRLELARQQMLHQALERREERRKERELLQSLAEIQLLDKQKEDEETRRARQEIEAWREEQWEKLRLISEQKTQSEKKREQKEKEKMQTKKMDKTHGGDITVIQEVADPSQEEMAATAKKAKAAEKKQRQKDRKKVQKQKEQASLDKKKKEQDLAAQKAAAAVQCTACGQGVLGCGFEKFEQKFCSSKCARTAKPIR
jgi:hypothetical protein